MAQGCRFAGGALGRLGRVSEGALAKAPAPSSSAAKRLSIAGTPVVLRERRCVDKEVGPLSLSGSFRFGCVGDKERRKALLEGKAAPTSAREDVETEAAAPGQKGAGRMDDT